MLATLYTVEGPQLTMDAVEAVKLLLKLPLSDYAISFQPGGLVMNTSDTDARPETEEKPATPSTPKSADQLLRQAGTGGFVSISSICGKIGKPRRPRRPLYRHSLHAGR